MMHIWYKMKKCSDSLIFKRVVLCVVMLVTFIVIYGLNRLYPIYLDDWDYSYVYWQPERVGGIFDAIRSQAIHYMKWGGRSVVHVILQTLLCWGPFWSDLLNTIAFVLFIAVLYLIANLGNKTRPSLYFMLIMLMWFFQADVGETVLWLTGSVNYMWGGLILFAFIYPHYKYYWGIAINKPKKENRDTFFRRALFFFFGIIAGWTNENMVVAMMCMLFVFLLSVWVKERNIEKWTVTGFVGACIGGALMMLAPGNYVRYRAELKDLGLTKAELGFDFYWSRFQVLMTDYSHYLLFLLIVYVLLITLFWFTSTVKYKRQIVWSSLIFFGGSLIATLAMVASPALTPRAWFGIISLVIIAVAIIYANLNFTNIYIQIGKWCCIIVLLFLFYNTYTEGKTELVHLRQILDNREVELEKQKSEGKQRIVWGGERFEDRAHRRLDLIIPKMYDLPQDTTHWMYKAYERYHGVKAVRFENEYPIKREK